MQRRLEGGIERRGGRARAVCWERDELGEAEKAEEKEELGAQVSPGRGILELECTFGWIGGRRGCLPACLSVSGQPGTVHTWQVEISLPFLSLINSSCYA